LNATELARNKFNALFAAYDAKDIRAAAEEQKFALKTIKKEAKKNVKPQWALTRREVWPYDIAKQVQSERRSRESAHRFEQQTEYSQYRILTQSTSASGSPGTSRDALRRYQAP
jgi:hypothetical protein